MTRTSDLLGSFSLISTHRNLSVTIKTLKTIKQAFLIEIVSLLSIIVFEVHKFVDSIKYCYMFHDGKRSKSNLLVLGPFLSEQIAKTVLETVFRSPIGPVVSEEIVFKNLDIRSKKKSV